MTVRAKAEMALGVLDEDRSVHYRGAFSRYPDWQGTEPGAGVYDVWVATPQGRTELQTPGEQITVDVTYSAALVTSPSNTAPSNPSECAYAPVGNIESVACNNWENHNAIERHPCE